MPIVKLVIPDTFIHFLQSGDPNDLPKEEQQYKIESFTKVEGITINASSIKDFNFDAGIEFIGCQFPRGIKFLNCKGRGGIKFINCTGPEQNQNEPKPAIEFQNFTFDHLSFEKCNLHSGIYLNRTNEKQEPNILSSLKISKGSFKDGGITIESVKFNHGIQLDHVTEGGQIILRNVETGDECSFRYVTADQIHFSGEGLIINGGISLKRSSLKDLRFTKGKVDGDISITEPRIHNLLSFNGISITGKTTLITKPKHPLPDEEEYKFSTVIPSVLINSTDFNEGFSFDGGEKTSKKVAIDFSPLLKGRLVFSNLNLEKLQLTGTNSENNLYFRNIGFNEILIDDFLNLKSVSLSNLNSEYTKSQKTTFKVQDSDLGNWELANFDFDSFAKIIWRDSQISGLRTSAVSWFKDRKLEAEGENDPSTCFRRREFYRQLKQASEKQGDRINELEFKRREIKAYRKGLKIRKENRWDRFTIWTGGSNNHGQSWGKALGLIIAFTLVIFYPLIISCVDPELTFWPINSNWKGFGFFWDKYKQYSDSIPELFNPTRRTDILYKDPTNLGWLRFWDGFHL